MAEGATKTIAGIVGREPELQALGEFLGADVSGRALVLSGAAGIGKTTLWEAGVELARKRGFRMLVARPSGTEARLSFAALIDMLEGVDVRELSGVPGPQRSALEVALLRAEPSGVPPEPHAIALGFLNCLRALAVQGPVLVAVDDIPWLDAASAEALVFALRRLKDEPVTFLLARRPGPRSTLEHVLQSWRLERLEVGPLGFAASRRLLSDRLGLVVSRQVLRRIVDSTLGNPLFVLEVGRAVVEQDGPAFGEEIPVPDGVEDMLGVRVARLEPPLQRLLLAVALSADPRIDELIQIAGETAVDDAVEAGLLIVDGRRARAAHPLLAAAAGQRAGPCERRELHRALAAAVSDQELHALHLALATNRPDAALAAIVATAAEDASARGARREAVRLAEHAMRLSDDDGPVREYRLLALARYLMIAGENGRLLELLMPQMASLPSGASRARLRLVMAEAVDSALEYERQLDLALAECGNDPELRARAVAGKTTNTAAATVARLSEAEASAVGVLGAARRAGPDVEREVLYGLSWARIMRGRPIDDLCERFHDASAAAFYISHSPIRVAVQRLLWRGELGDARRELTRLAELADEQGEPASSAVLRFHCCELELRAGELDAASRLLDEWAAFEDAELLPFPMYERCRALLAAARGLPGETERWVATAIERGNDTGAHIDRLEALRARGTAALLARDPGQARESLGAVWDHCCREGVDELGAFPVAPELVEALAELGEVDTAHAVVVRLRDLSEQQRHPWGLASTDRCEGLLQMVRGPYDERAALMLAGAAEDYERLGLRFDSARTLLSLGRAQRRFKKWGPARASLDGAIVAFEDLGALGWAQRARSELGRVGARRPQTSGELTATEREVVELAASGRANKEIAQALSLAVHTVEVHLSRAYAKLGVRSRAQLASRMSTRS